MDAKFLVHVPGKSNGHCRFVVLPNTLLHQTGCNLCNDETHPESVQSLLDVADPPSGAQSGGHARLNVEILAVKYLEDIFTESSLRKTYGKIADSSDR